MAKQTLCATLVKLSASGVGVARLSPANGRDATFVYFHPRYLSGYHGETWPELAAQGLIPGRALLIEVDLDAAGAVPQVSAVRIAATRRPCGLGGASSKLSLRRPGH